MADQFTNGQGQPASGFTAQEEQTAVAFGLSPSDAGLTYSDKVSPFATDFNAQPGEAGFYAASPGGAPSTWGQKKVVDAFVDLTNMGPDDLKNLQQRLYDAGFYDASYYKNKGPKIHFGELDDGTVSAYKGLILQAVRSNGSKTPDDILSAGINAGYGDQQKQQANPKPPPLTIQLTSPDALLAVADSVSEKVLGRKLTDSELRNFVDSYHTMEAQAQQQKYNDEYSQGYDEASGSFRGPGGTVTTPPSPTEYAMTELKAQNPQDARNVEMEHGYDVVDQLLHSRSGA